MTREISSIRLARRLVAAVTWRGRRRTLRTDITEIIRTIVEVAAAAMAPSAAMPESILTAALVVAVLPVALIGIGADIRLRLAAARDESR